MRHGLVLCAALVFAGAAMPIDAQTTAEEGRATVLWISVDGFRHDYVEKVHPPFLSRMMKEGAYSTHMQTIFPSLTFPSHVAEATGTTVDHHGVPANDFYDRVTRKTWVFPPDGQMLTAEPIWNTATRQGVRTEVFDWPLSQMERGPTAAALFHDYAFNGKLSARQRMDELITAYENDKDNPPLRLVMGYMEPVDHAGHTYGPEAQQTAAAVLEADTELERTFDRIYKAFEAKRTSPNDTFYFLMTTDHGMTTVKTLVRLDFLLGLPPELHEPPAAATTQGSATQGTGSAAAATQPKWVGGAAAQHRDVILVTSGPLANIYLSDTLSLGARESRIKGYLEKLRAKPYLRAWRQEELPAKFHYRSPTRIGDIVVMLNEPYTFSNRTPGVEYPADKGGGPLGMHGYSVTDNPDMEGFTVMWRSRQNWGGKDLGVIHSTQFHATVAKWLGIAPAPAADRHALTE